MSLPLFSILARDPVGTGFFEGGDIDSDLVIEGPGLSTWRRNFLTRKSLASIWCRRTWRGKDIFDTSPSIIEP